MKIGIVFCGIGSHILSFGSNDAWDRTGHQMATGWYSGGSFRADKERVYKLDFEGIEDWNT
jgi:hypothetical protein